MNKSKQTLTIQKGQHEKIVNTHLLVEQPSIVFKEILQFF